MVNDQKSQARTIGRLEDMPEWLQQMYHDLLLEGVPAEYAEVMLRVHYERGRPLAWSQFTLHGHPTYAMRIPYSGGDAILAIVTAPMDLRDMKGEVVEHVPVKSKLN